MQIERIAWRYRVLHWGMQADVQVMTVHAAQLLSLMSDRPKPDLSKFLFSPLPGRLTEIAHQARPDGWR